MDEGDQGSRHHGGVIHAFRKSARDVLCEAHEFRFHMTPARAVASHFLCAPKESGQRKGARLAAPLLQGAPVLLVRPGACGTRKSGSDSPCITLMSGHLCNDGRCWGGGTGQSIGLDSVHRLSEISFPPRPAPSIGILWPTAATVGPPINARQRRAAHPSTFKGNATEA